MLNFLGPLEWAAFLYISSGCGLLKPLLLFTITPLEFVLVVSSLSLDMSGTNFKSDSKVESNVISDWDSSVSSSVLSISASEYLDSELSG